MGADQQPGESETLFRAIVEHAPEGVLMADYDGKIVMVNKEAERLFGFSREELIGQDVEFLVPDALRTRHLAMREVYQANPVRRGMADRQDLRGVRKDGSEVPIDVGLAPCTYDGKPHVVASIRDMTKRRADHEALLHSEARLGEALEDLEEREEHLSNLISSIPDAVITVDEEGAVEEVNPAAVILFGRSADEFEGMDIEALFAPEVAKAIRIDRRRTEGLDFLKGAALSADVLKANGDDFRAAITVNGFRASGGRKYLWIVRDISHELRYEKERQSLMRALEEKNRELESIIYAASHDLRSPLVNLQGFSDELDKSCRKLADLLADAPLPDATRDAVMQIVKEDVPESLGFIDSSSRKMDQLISGLLRLSRIGNSELHLKRLDMNDLVSEVVRSVQYSIDEIGAKVAVESLPPCMGDAGQINQVFSNLVDNAIKYRRGDRECRIRISGVAKSRDSIFYVDDNGQGIAPAHRDKAFEVFHRLQPSSGIKGEGLGLAIVRRIVDKHNGEVRVDASPEGGCRFVVTLPAPRLTEIRDGTQRVFHAGTGNREKA